MQNIIELAIRYLNGLWIYRWMGLAVAWVICLCGWLFVFSIPDVYEAKSRFYVDASSRLREVVQDLGMEPDVSSRVFLVRQAMLGKPQLEKVARETDLDLRANTPEQSENLITRLREGISIETGRRQEAKNLFAISYADQDRKMALNVVTALLNNFLDDVLARKDTDTERTKDFLEEQLSYYRTLLEDTEKKLEVFKRDHAGFVVGDRGSYFERMQEQEELVNQLVARYTVEEDKRNELRRQLSQVNPYVANPDETFALIPGSETSTRIAELERQKRDLLLRVTDRHPDVRAINEQVAQLRGQLKRELQNTSENTIDGARSATNPVYVEIQIALSNANLQITQLSGEISHAGEKLAALRNEVDSAPELEREFVRLTRDYTNYQRLYSEVLEKAERERIGRVGEDKDIISFNVIDPPAVSLDPIAPKRGLLLFGVLIAAFGAAVAAAFFLWQLKPTFSDEKEVMDETGYPVLGTISLDLRHIGHSRKANVLRFAAATSVLILCFVGVLAIQDQAVSAIQTVLGRGV